MMKNILLLTYNEELLNRFKKLVEEKKINKSNNFSFNYAYSPNNRAFIQKYQNTEWIKPLKVKENIDFLINEYDLIISLHCKQLFPSSLVEKVKCINIHPGLNPNNRGWFPQVIFNN